MKKTKEKLNYKDLIVSDIEDEIAREKYKKSIDKSK